MLQAERGVPGGPSELKLRPVIIGKQDILARIPDETLARAKIADQALIGRLHEFEVQRRDREPSFTRLDIGMRFRNSVLGGLAQPEYTSASITSVIDTLASHGTFTLHIELGHRVMVDGESTEIRTLEATPDNGGDMGGAHGRSWRRDGLNAGISLRSPERHVRIDLGDYEERSDLAHDLITSNLHPLSTPAQLDRLTNLIQGDDDFRSDYVNWPHIAPLKDNLDGENRDEWRNKQESCQAVAVEVIDALDTGLIKLDELKPGNKKFLASVMPFLAAVDFTAQTNSGPWEEAQTVKTSVIGVETGLLYKLRQHVDREGFEFLSEVYDANRGYLPEGFQTLSYKEALDVMLRQGLTKIGKTFPSESPNYPQSSPEYRDADAALIYLLLHGIPELLDTYQIPMSANGGQPMKKEQIEDMLLAKLETLRDPETNGIKRYIHDTYLGPNYNTNEIQLQINEMKAGLKQEAGEGNPIDLIKKAELRKEIVQEGAEAGWSHPNAEIAGWAAGEYLRTKNERYLKIATKYFNYMLTTITGEGEHSLLLDANGVPYIKEVKAFRAPEAWTTYITKDGESFVGPSPNTPLCWAAARTFEASRTLQAAISLHEHLSAMQGGQEFSVWTPPTAIEPTVVYAMSA